MRLLTARQVAEMLQVSEETVRRLARRRVLRGHRVGGMWRFHPEAIDEYLFGAGSTPTPRQAADEVAAVRRRRACPAGQPRR